MEELLGALARCLRRDGGRGLGSRGKLHPRWRRPLQAGNTRLGFDFYLKSKAVSPQLFWGCNLGLCGMNCRSALSCRVCVLRGGGASLQNRRLFFFLCIPGASRKGVYGNRRSWLAQVPGEIGATFYSSWLFCYPLPMAKSCCL